ncbi:MAG: S1C family serine protease [Chloroflexi bacterium]|nr:S1C family serine protease [Chloroflexota bacterium]
MGSSYFCALLYLALPLVALQWADLPFPGFVHDPNLVVSDVGNNSQWPAKLMTPPVIYPDRVTAVNGIPLSSTHQFNAQLSVYEIGDEVDLVLTQPQKFRHSSQSFCHPRARRHTVSPWLSKAQTCGTFSGCIISVASSVY